MGVKSVADQWERIRDYTKESAEAVKELAPALSKANEANARSTNPATNGSGAGLGLGEGFGGAGGGQGGGFRPPTGGGPSGGSGHGGFNFEGNRGVVTTGQGAGNGPGIQKAPKFPGMLSPYSAGPMLSPYSAGAMIPAGPQLPNDGARAAATVGKAVTNGLTEVVKELRKITRALSPNSGVEFRRRTGV